MKSCDICEISSNEVKIFDAIRDLRMTNLCERCSIIENIPIIKAPNANQLKESETIRVSEKMREISGIRMPKKEVMFLREERLSELNKNPELEQPEKGSLNLIDHFHWEILKQRRRKGLSQKQLAESIGESESSIQMIEKAKLPEKAKHLINKIEQVFQISLRKKSENVKFIEDEPILLDDEGDILSTIPEDEEMIFIEEDTIEDLPTKSAEEISLTHAEKTLGIEIPKDNKKFKEKIPFLPEDKDLDIKRVNKENVTIGDLQKLHEKKSTQIEKERIAEQKKLEERRRLLQESRERDRLRIDQQKKEDELEKLKAYGERKKLIEQRKREVEVQREKENKDIHKYLGGSELLNPNYKKENENRNNIKEFDEELF